MESEQPVHVGIAGAVGQVGYMLSIKVANGDLLGDKPIILHLQDTPNNEKHLHTLALEIKDSCLKNVVGVIEATDDKDAFENLDYCFLTTYIPKKPNITDDTYLERNAAIYRDFGAALSKYAKPDVKVLVTGCPSNTNCYTAIKSASHLMHTNFAALARLDQNRIVNQLSQKVNIPHQYIKNVIVWGNRSDTQVPDVTHGRYQLPGQEEKSVMEVLDKQYVCGPLISCFIGHRSNINQFSLTSVSASTSTAAIQQMRDWIFGTAPGEYTSMAIRVPKSSPYGIKPFIVFSMPCTVENGFIKIVEDIELDQFIQERIQTSANECAHEIEQIYNIFLEDDWHNIE